MRARKYLLLLVVAFFAVNLPIAHGSDSSLQRSVTALGLNTSGDTYELQVTPAGNPNGYRAAALNVTVVDGEAAAVGGYVTVFPCGDRPVASNVNFVDGQTVPNAVIAPVSADGRVCLYVYGKAHVLVDVAGYFSAGFSALSKPERFLDTRTSGVKVGEPTKGSGVLTGGATKAPAGPVALGLNLTGASALVQTSQVSARSVMENRVPYTARLSNLYKITTSGSVESVVTNKNVTFDDAVVGPNGKMYSITSGQECLLAETDLTTNESTCLEKSENSWVIWQSNETANFPRIQFDKSGGVFYMMRSPYRPGTPHFEFSLRRYQNGVITEMFDLPKQNIRFWYVASNGSVIFSGQTLDEDVNGQGIEIDHATRIVTRDRMLSVLSDAQAWFFSDFGTDLVYYGLCGPKINDPLNFECGHRIYDSVTGQVRDTYFLSGSNNTPRASAIYDADEICAAYPAVVLGSFCGSYGNIAGPFSSTTDGAYFAKIEAVMQPFPPTHLSQVFQYYPEVKPVVSSVLKARIIETEGDDLFLSGVDRTGNFKTIKLNTKSGSESTMLSVADGIDVVELEAVGSENKLYFRGTRVAGGSEVIGFVNLTTGAVTIQNFAQGSVVNIEAVSQ